MNSHTLIHLSKSQWKRLEPNSIHLTGKHVTDGLCLYNSIIYGDNIEKHIGTEKTLQPHNVMGSKDKVIMLENVKKGWLCLPHQCKNWVMILRQINYSQ